MGRGGAREQIFFHSGHYFVFHTENGAYCLTSFFVADSRLPTTSTAQAGPVNQGLSARDAVRSKLSSLIVIKYCSAQSQSLM